MILEYNKVALKDYACPCGKILTLDPPHTVGEFSAACEEFVQAHRPRRREPNVARLPNGDWYFLFYNVGKFFFQVIPVDQVLSVQDSNSLLYPKVKKILTSRADLYLLCSELKLLPELEKAVGEKNFRKWATQGMMKSITGTITGK